MPTKPSVTVAQEIARRNRIFSAATKAQKRVLLAQDVIDQLKTGKFRAETGRWVELDYHYKLDNKVSVQQAILQNDIPQCSVCALGGLLTSCVLFKNKITVGDYRNEKMDWCNNDEGGVTEEVGLRNIFSMPQLQLIEQAFERGNGFYGDRPTDKEEEAIDFGEQYDDDNERLIAIMQNIIAHKGRFVP